MRLFVAIVPPRSALAELAAVVDQVRTDCGGHGAGAVPGGSGAVTRMRWTSSEQWHLTLAFLGEVDERVLPQLSTRLERAASRHPAPRLAIAGAGAFPRPARARVLWAGIRADNRALAGLAASVAAAARRAGAPSPDEGRRFAAHLTLARCQEDADLSHLTGALAGFTGQQWGADSVYLVRSYQSGGVSLHENLAQWPLRPEPSGPA